MCKGSPKRVQCLHEFKNADLTAKRNEWHISLPGVAALGQLVLRDQRDLPMLYLTSNILAWLIPMGTLVIYAHMNEWQYRTWLGLGYVVSWLILFVERYILMLHYHSHLNIFKPEYRWMGYIISGLLPVAFGIPMATYYMHHVIMHHVENNHDEDISSTEKYDRTKVSSFLRYWARFTMLIGLELPIYAYKKKRWMWLAALTASMGLFYPVMWILMAISNSGTFWVFCVPHMVGLTAMAFGNYSQHIFVDPDNANSNYALTYNCLDTAGNQTTFNDGYHVLHHLQARLHWKELPETFHTKEVLETMRANKAINFRSIHFFDVGVHVLSGNLRRLVEKYYVHISKQSIDPEDKSEEEIPTVDEVVAMLEHRLKPVPQGMSGKDAKKGE